MENESINKLNKNKAEAPKIEYKQPDIFEESLQRIENVFGKIRTVSSAPTWTPRRFVDQFAVYQNSTTYRFYIYDVSNNAWRYVALT